MLRQIKREHYEISSLNVFNILTQQKLNHIKVFVYFDYGTCRTYDVFVTDADYTMIDVFSTNIDIMQPEDEGVTLEDLSVPDFYSDSEDLVEDTTDPEPTIDFTDYDDVPFDY